MARQRALHNDVPTDDEDTESEGLSVSRAAPLKHEVGGRRIVLLRRPQHSLNSVPVSEKSPLKSLINSDVKEEDDQSCVGRAASSHLEFPENVPTANHQLTLEERELAYEEARRRIFGDRGSSNNIGGYDSSNYCAPNIGMQVRVPRPQPLYIDPAIASHRSFPVMDVSNSDCVSTTDARQHPLMSPSLLQTANGNDAVVYQPHYYILPPPPPPPAELSFMSSSLPSNCITCRDKVGSVLQHSTATLQWESIPNRSNASYTNRQQKITTNGTNTPNQNSRSGSSSMSSTLPPFKTVSYDINFPPLGA